MSVAEGGGQDPSVFKYDKGWPYQEIAKLLHDFNLQTEKRVSADLILKAGKKGSESYPVLDAFQSVLVKMFTIKWQLNFETEIDNKADLLAFWVDQLDGLNAFIVTVVGRLEVEGEKSRLHKGVSDAFSGLKRQGLISKPPHEIQPLIAEPLQKLLKKVKQYWGAEMERLDEEEQLSLRATPIKTSPQKDKEEEDVFFDASENIEFDLSLKSEWPRVGELADKMAELQSSTNISADDVNHFVGELNDFSHLHGVDNAIVFFAPLHTLKIDLEIKTLRESGVSSDAKSIQLLEKIKLMPESDGFGLFSLITDSDHAAIIFQSEPGVFSLLDLMKEHWNLIRTLDCLNPEKDSQMLPMSSELMMRFVDKLCALKQFDEQQAASGGAQQTQISRHEQQMIFIEKLMVAETDNELSEEKSHELFAEANDSENIFFGVLKADEVPGESLSELFHAMAREKFPDIQFKVANTIQTSLFYPSAPSGRGGPSPGRDSVAKPPRQP